MGDGVMSIDSVFVSGLQGIQKGLQGARTSAAEIAGSAQSSSSDPNAMTDALIALKQHELQVAAAARTIEAADDMIGSLIDVLV
jgi:hypothetical protein